MYGWFNQAKGIKNLKQAKDIGNPKQVEDINNTDQVKEVKDLKLDDDIDNNEDCEELYEKNYEGKDRFEDSSHESF